MSARPATDWYIIIATSNGWAVMDVRTGRIGQEWRTQREAEIDRARILIRNMMHG